VVGVEPVSESHNKGRQSPTSNLALRVVSAAVLAPLALLTAFLGGWPFAVFWAIAALFVLWEWIELVADGSHRLMFSWCAGVIVAAGFFAWLGRPVVGSLMVGLAMLGAAIFAPSQRRLWVTLGVGYAGAMLLAPMFLRGDNTYGFASILVLFAVVWSTDVFGYFAGRAIGGPRLLPAVSPKKTWSGAIVGAAAAMLIAAYVASLFEHSNVVAILIIAFVLSALAQMGDLFESWVKRQFGAKDSGQLIPGHGGVMDRLDGFWAAAVAGCLIGMVRGGFDGPARGLLLW